MRIFEQFKDIDLTLDQKNAVEQIASFLESDKGIFVLKGYAGSGKTTLIKGLVKHLSNNHTAFQLMAPTGRAAKIIEQKSNSSASTIHRGIYNFDVFHEIEKDDSSESFMYYYKIAENPEVHNSVLIIDEASMISNVKSIGEFFRFGSGYLLNDLISYSRIQQQANHTKIIFVVKTAIFKIAIVIDDPDFDGTGSHKIIGPMSDAGFKFEPVIEYNTSGDKFITRFKTIFI